MPRDGRGPAHFRSRHWSELLRGRSDPSAERERSCVVRAMAGWGSFYRGEGLEEEEEQQEEEERPEAVGKDPPPPHGRQPAFQAPRVEGPLLKLFPLFRSGAEVFGPGQHHLLGGCLQGHVRVRRGGRDSFRHDHPGRDG